LTGRGPQRWSRGLALVEWCQLAVPHYIIVGLFSSSGTAGGYAGGGLLSVLVVFSAVWLLFTGRYPAGIFDLVMGLRSVGLSRHRLRRLAV
jgi:hypothetical protein